MRDRTPLGDPMTHEIYAPRSTRAASIDIHSLTLGPAQALLITLREEAYYRQAELDQALRECEAANLRADKYMKIA